MAAIQTEFELEVGPHPAGDLQVLSFECEERLSAPFELDVTVVPAEGVDPDAAALVGEPACLSVHLPDEATRFVDGIVAGVRRWDEGRRPIDRRLRLTVVPTLWRLGKIFRSRIFQDKNVPEIVQQVLKDGGVPQDRIKVSLSATYRKREYTVQYRETDLDFVHRLLEDEGIFYWFEHEQGRHEVVLADATSAHAPIAHGDAQVPFHEKSDMAVGEHVDELEASHEVVSGKVTLRDFDWKRPTVNLTQAKDTGGADKDLEVYEYPGGYDDPGAGGGRARLRLEALRAQVARLRGGTGSRRLEPGRTFELTEHPVDAVNGELLVLAASHHGDQREILQGAEAGAARPERWRTRFVAQPKSVPFRPERRTPRPIAHGAETARVVGPQGEEIHTDNFGRVKVQFHWDREGKKDEHSSCWMRVAQAWAGPGWGALFLPRIGHEVVVEFQDGNPDRPLVTGSVYNGANPVPYPLPDEKTKSTLKSATSPGSGGSNELRFEDAAGSEEIYLHAQKDLNVQVEHDRTESVGANDTLTVHANRTIAVRGSQTLTVTGSDTTTVGGAQSLTVGGTRTVTIAKAHTETVGAAQTIMVGAAQAITVGGAAAETVGGAKALTVGGAYQVTVGAALNETVGAVKAEEIGGNKTEAVGGNKTDTVAGNRTLSVGGDLADTVTGKRTVKVGKNLVVNAGANLSQTATKTWTYKAKEIVFEAEDGVSIKAGDATITLKKNGDVVVKGKKIDVKASGDITLKGSKIAEN